jgi:hypothetical protein
LATLIRSAWILDEDDEGRAEVAMALESAGYRDIVAFETARQLLAHRPSEAPALAVVDSSTAGMGAREIHRALSGVPLVVLLSSDEHDGAWRSLGVMLLLRKPPSTQTLGVAGFGVSEEPSGARAVPCELYAGPRTITVEADDDMAECLPSDEQPPPWHPSARSLEVLLARFGSVR